MSVHSLLVCSWISWQELWKGISRLDRHEMQGSVDIVARYHCSYLLLDYMLTTGSAHPRGPSPLSPHISLTGAMSIIQRW